MYQVDCALRLASARQCVDDCASHAHMRGYFVFLLGHSRTRVGILVLLGNSDARVFSVGIRVISSRSLPGLLVGQATQRRGWQGFSHTYFAHTYMYMTRKTFQQPYVLATYSITRRHTSHLLGCVASRSIRPLQRVRAYGLTSSTCRSDCACATVRARMCVCTCMYVCMSK